MLDDKANVVLWRERGRKAALSAQRLYQIQDFWGCSNRAYYAAYQVCTATCVAHGDKDKFFNGWNNPSHEQLPQLISNNGDLPVSTRRQLRANLAFLRNAREDSDYRVGRTVDEETARRCLRFVGNIFGLLEVDEE